MIRGVRLDNRLQLEKVTSCDVALAMCHRLNSIPICKLRGLREYELPTYVNVSHSTPLPMVGVNIQA